MDEEGLHAGRGANDELDGGNVICIWTGMWCA